MKLILDKTELKEYASDKRYWQGIPAVEVTKKGRIFSAWYSGQHTEQLGNYSDLAIVAYRAHLGELILTALIKNMFITFPPPNNSTEERYHRFFLAGAFYNVFIEWLKGGLHESPEVMARICAEMATNGCPTPFDEVDHRK